MNEKLVGDGVAQTPLLDLERFCIAFTWAYGTALERKHYPGTEPDDGHTPETLWMASPEEEREFLRGVMRDALAAYSVSSTDRATPPSVALECDVEQLARDMQSRVSGQPRGALLYAGYLTIARELIAHGADGILAALTLAQPGGAVAGTERGDPA